jgi:hypothetical protein
MVFMIFFFVAYVSAVVNCGSERVNKVLACSSVTTPNTCAISVQSDSNNGGFFDCDWIGSSCTTRSTNCNPRCDMNGYTERTSGCIGSSNCTFNYFNSPTYGKHLCTVWPTGQCDLGLACVDGTAQGQCIGTMLTSTCTGLPQFNCTHSYTSTNGISSDCQWISGSCSKKSTQCTSYCTGVVPSSDCRSEPSYTCEGRYGTTGSINYNCVYLTSLGVCNNTSPIVSCNIYGPVNCTGPNGACTITPCSYWTSAAICADRCFKGSTGSRTQCAWDPTFNQCYPNTPCINPITP